MVATLDTTLRETTKFTYQVVRVGQVVVPAFDLTTSHDSDRSTASATVMIEAPLRTFMREGSTVEIVAGYEGVGDRIFHGYAISLDSQLDKVGRWVTISAKGWCNLLADRPTKTMRWSGPIRLKEIVRSVLNHFQVPSYLIDDITYDNGQPIVLGTNRQVGSQFIELSANSEALGWLRQLLELFGYAIFDTGSGEIRVKRLSGLPVGEPVMHVAQGEIGFFYSKLRTSDGMANYWRVTGASYTDEDGVQQQIASIPATITRHIAIRGRQIRKRDRSSEVLDTAALADQARNVLERDFGVPIENLQWTTELAPSVSPGDVAEVVSPAVQADESVWITAVEHRLPRGGMKTTTFRGRRGNGTALPAGNDCVTMMLRADPVHLGDEVVPWYASPSPSGREVSIEFQVYDDYTSMKIVGLAHGCNSYLIGNTNAEASVSRFVILQGGEEISTGDLPVLAEDYNAQLPYASGDQHWGRFAVPMPGKIKPGTATLKIISGEDSRLPADTRWDDFEVKQVRIISCGVGHPEIVGGE